MNTDDKISLFVQGRRTRINASHGVFTVVCFVAEALCK